MYGQRRTGRTSTKCARRAREPWLLAVSPSLSHLNARTITRLYAQAKCRVGPWETIDRTQRIDQKPLPRSLDRLFQAEKHRAKPAVPAGKQAHLHYSTVSKVLKGVR